MSIVYDLKTRIIRYVDRQGLTQKELVEKTGLAKETISRILSVKNRIYPGLETLEKVAVALGIPLYKFFVPMCCQTVKEDVEDLPVEALCNAWQKMDHGMRLVLCMLIDWYNEL